MAKTKDKLKGLKEGELRVELQNLREKLRVIRFQFEGARSKNVKEQGALRKEVARVLTLLNNQ